MRQAVPRLAQAAWKRRGRVTEAQVPARIVVVLYATFLLCIPSQLVFGPLGAPGTPANVLGIASLVWWCCATLGGLYPSRGVTPIRVAAAVLVAAVMASYVAGMTSGWYAPPGLHQASDDVVSLIPPTLDQISEKVASAAGRGLISLAAWLGIVLVSADGLRSWADLDKVVTWLCRLGAVVAALGLIQFYWHVDIKAWFDIPGLTANSDFGSVTARSVLNRPSATAVHPIEFGVVMGALLPLALHRTITHWHQKLVLIPTVLIGIGMMIAISRSAIVVFGLALIVLMLGWPMAWRGRALVALPVIVVVTRGVFPGLVGTLYSLFSNFFNDPSVQGRTDDYAVVFHLISQQPILGRGVYTFVPVYFRVLDNQILVFLLELGILGTLVVLGFFLTGFLNARGAFRHALQQQNRHLGLALSASIAGLILGYATFDAWSFPMAAGLTFLLVGLSAATWRITEAETGGRPSRRQADDSPQHANPPQKAKRVDS